MSAVRFCSGTTPSNIRRLKFLCRMLLTLGLSWADAAHAQTSDVAKYFPVSVGNRWSYYEAGTPYEIVTAQIVLRDTFQINGKTYYNFAGFYSGHDTLSAVTGDKVYYLNQRTDQLFYSLSAKVGDTWELSLPFIGSQPTSFTAKLESRTDTVRVRAGTFTNCLRVSFKAKGIADADWTDWLAPNVGRVFRAAQIPSELRDALVGGVQYPRPIPSLIFPADSAINVSVNPTLRWNACAGATTYIVQVSPYNPSFMTFVYDDATSDTSQVVGPLNPGTKYYWHVGAMSNGVWGSWSATRQFTAALMNSVQKEGNTIPMEFGLSQNYPNPFNPSTTISYSLPKTAVVTLRIFNTLGQEIALLVNEREEAGYHQATWNASNVPSGVYFYRLNARQIDGGHAGESVLTKKMILLK